MMAPQEPAIRPLDASTVLVAALGTYAILAAAMLAHFLTRPIYPGFREWLLAPLAQALGLLVIAAYPTDRLPNFAAVIAANLLLVASADQVYRGLLHFAHLPARATPGELLFYGAALGVFCWYLFIDYSVPARVAVNGVAMAFATAKGARRAWREASGEARGTARFLAGALTAAAAVHLGRTAAALSTGRADTMRPVGMRVGPETTLLLLSALLGAATFLGLLLMVSRRAQNELQLALSRVKRLEGIIPICMHCYRVRTDKDSWDRLETYVGEHTEAEFSHGICPDCLERHYPVSGEGGGQPPGGGR